MQRVNHASVSSAGRELAAIGPGLVVLLGVGEGDSREDAERLAERVRALRIFDDRDGRMNEALGEREALCVSQFTLYAETRRGNRPSYARAAGREAAEPLYEHFCESLGARRGAFGEHMEVELSNDGPVTLMLES